MPEAIYYTLEELDGAERALRMLYDAFNEADAEHQVKLHGYLRGIFHLHKDRVDLLIKNYKPEPQY